MMTAISLIERDRRVGEIVQGLRQGRQETQLAILGTQGDYYKYY
jgi:hypothetical protein